MILLQINQLESLNDKVIAAMIAAIASVAVGLLSIFISYINNRQQIKDRKRSERRAELSKMLYEFYGPFQQYLNNSRELYRIFSSDKPKDFRALTYLLDPQQEYDFPDGTRHTVILSDNDSEILDQIIHVGQKMEELIIEKGGVVDDPELRLDYKVNTSITDVNLQDSGLLAVARTHFQVLRLAKAQKLKGGIEKFKNYVYPRELNQKIENKISELQGSLASLNG